jgi:hypothetical protein|nr:MAG TPA: hypothetical protein [Caudoviricetes sp.]
MSHTLGVDSTPHRPSTVDAPSKVGAHKEERTDAVSNALDEEMLIRHMDTCRTNELLNGQGSHIAILVEHMDGTDYEVSVNDRKETPEHLTALLATVARGADMMIRALDILRTIGYVDMRPVALLGREIVFGLDRVTLELEIIEHSDGELDCGISVAGVDQGNVEEIEGVLEENDIDIV